MNTRVTAVESSEIFPGLKPAVRKQVRKQVITKSQGSFLYLRNGSRRGTCLLCLVISFFYPVVCKHV